jgi:hypothetical protein
VKVPGRRRIKRRARVSLPQVSALPGVHELF